MNVGIGSSSTTITGITMFENSRFITTHMSFSIWRAHKQHGCSLYTEQCNASAYHSMPCSQLPFLACRCSILAHKVMRTPNTTYDPGYRSYESLLLSIETSNYRCMESLACSKSVAINDRTMTWTRRPLPSQPTYPIFYPYVQLQSPLGNNERSARN